MRKTKPLTYLLLASLLAFASGAAHGQARLNLGFEPDVNRPHPLLFWTHSKNSAVHVTLDTTTAARQGRGSVRIELEPGEDVPSATVNMSNLLLDSLRGNMTVRAYLRTAGFRGKAGLRAYASAGQFERLVSVDSVKTRPADSEWQLLEIRFPLSEKARSLNVNLSVEGTGRVWFDAVEVLVGNRRYRDVPLPGTEPFLLPPAAPNWDFERPLAANLAAPPLYIIDSVAPARGRRSLLLTPPPGRSDTHAYLGVLPGSEEKKSKMLTVSGYVRTAAGSPAPALYYTLLGEHRNPAGVRGISAIHNRNTYQELPLPTSAAWQPFRVQVPLPALLNDDFHQLVSLGVHLRGPEPVGLDALSFEVDGQALATAPATAAPAPSAAEVAWLRPHLLPVPLAPPLADLAPLAALRPVFAPARVVGLGQVTASSVELAQLKFRLFRLLAEQQGFTYLVLDADMVAATALDAYVQGGPGNAPALLAALGPAYGTPPLAALVQWLRTYNQRPGVARLHVAGLQPQQPLAALAALRSEPAFQPPAAQQLLQKTEQALAALGQAVRAGASAEELLPPAATATNLVQELAAYFDVRAKIGGRPANSATLAWPRQLLRLLVQHTTTYSLPGQQRSFYQTAALAENVYWLSQQPGAPKLAVWGHNDLVALTDDNDRPLGQWLRTTFGLAYVAVGCTFHQGTYRAGGDDLATAQASYPGTVEAWLHATGLPAALLPLRPLKLNDNNAWLFQSQLLRDIRQPAPAQDFHLHQPRLEFDALLFVDAIKE